MAKWSLLFLYFSQGLLPIISGQEQQRAVGPWRHRFQWENNGQVYSLLSTGSEYQAPVLSRNQQRVYVSSRTRDDTSARQLRADLSAEPGVSPVQTRQEGPRPRNQELLREVTEATYRQPAGRSISAREEQSVAAGPFSEDAPNEAGSYEENMVNDEPRNPFKNHRNSVFHNAYPSSGRAHRPPSMGYGTQYFQNGK